MTTPPPAPVSAFVNFGGETVAECAARMLTSIEGDRPQRRTARDLARLTAEAVAKSWRTVGDESMREFYWQVAAHLAQRVEPTP
jgi:ubiquinone biosynthesis protein UbiJ